MPCVLLETLPLNSGGGPVWVACVCVCVCLGASGWFGSVWVLILTPGTGVAGGRPEASYRAGEAVRRRLWGEPRGRGRPFGGRGLGTEKGATLCGPSSHKVSPTGGNTASSEHRHYGCEGRWQPSTSSSAQGDPEARGRPLCPRPLPFTRAALLQLLHCHWLSWWRRILHTAQQRLHEARPVGRADAYVVAGLVLQRLLASSV